MVSEVARACGSLGSRRCAETDFSHDGGIHMDHYVRQPHRNVLERQEEHPLFLLVGHWEHRLVGVRRRVGTVQPGCARYCPPRVRHLGDIRVERKSPLEMRGENLIRRSISQVSESCATDRQPETLL